MSPYEAHLVQTKKKMSHRKQFVGQLMSQFKNGMLPSLSKEEPRAMECMAKAHIDAASAGKLPIEFALGELFDAVWLWGKEAGVELPIGSNYQQDFKEFCSQLMEPWPLDALDRAGLEIRPIRSRSNLKVSKRYEITRLQRPLSTPRRA